jgi:predicted enzyme related to lactoylglutathione lyase
MANRVMHFEFIAKDRPRLREFYTGLFGWTPEDVPGMDYTMLHPGDSGIDGAVGTAQPNGLPAGMTIYVQVDDVEKGLAEAQKRGAKTVQTPYDVPGVGRLAVFADPEGNRVGLWKVAAS